MTVSSKHTTSLGSPGSTVYVCMRKLPLIPCLPLSRTSLDILVPKSIMDCHPTLSMFTECTMKVKVHVHLTILHGRKVYHPSCKVIILVCNTGDMDGSNASVNGCARPNILNPITHSKTQPNYVLSNTLNRTVASSINALGQPKKHGFMHVNT